MCVCVYDGVVGLDSGGDLVCDVEVEVEVEKAYLRGG